MQSVVAPLCEAVLFGWHLREGVRASVAGIYSLRFNRISCISLWAQGRLPLQRRECPLQLW